MQKHIAVDIGASSGRLVLGTLEDGQIKLEELYRFDNSIGETNGSYFWNIDKLYQEIIKGLQAAKAAGIEECTLGFDTWAVDYVLVDENGNRVQEVYAYRDDRTKTAIEEVAQHISLNEIYQKTGIQFLSFNTLFQLYVHDKAELAKAHKILLVPDYLYYLFSGKYVNEKTNASTTQLLNLATKDYDEDLLKLVGVRREQFAELTEPGQSLGPILEKLRIKYDLPRCELICVASHDTASAVLGVPAVEEHFAYLSSGTWSLIGLENTAAIANEMSYQNNYTNEWGAYGTYRFLKNIMGLWMIQEVRRNLGNYYSFADLVVEAEKAVPFKFLVDCNNERFLNPESMIREIQNYCRETGQGTPESAGELARCIFDSLALTYRLALEEICSIAGCRAGCLHIVGGGVQNELLCQLTADVAQTAVAAGPVEATALGNLLVQMISTGGLKDIKAARELIMASFAIKMYQPGKIANLEAVYQNFRRLVAKPIV
ncbi:MAG: Rhamnulokinase [Firmicutes bacterium]|nr:Rhamnulokinase [Bacillota bacterium]